MTTTDRFLTLAGYLQAATADAYSFGYYGAKNWLACVHMLLERGYNSVEVECIMRSKLTRWATDNITGRRKANATDMADLMDNRCGGPVRLRQYIDEMIIETMHPESVKLTSRDALRLAWTR